MPIKQSQHHDILSNLIYAILEHCNVSLGFNMFQLWLIAASKNINLIVELLMAQSVDVSITQNMVIALGWMKCKLECNTLMSIDDDYVSIQCFICMFELFMLCPC